jgi:hypothetical protein
MTRPAALFTIAFALGAIILAPRSAVRAQDTREGPIEIEKCKTIDKPGSYKLVNNLTFTGTTGACLPITVSNVMIDLAGFSIISLNPQAVAIAATPPSGQVVEGIVVRNGSISGFNQGVVALGGGSIVEGLRLSGNNEPFATGISAAGIVKGNTVVGFVGIRGSGVGIGATGIITGNFVEGNGLGMAIGLGSTVIGNTAVNNGSVELPRGGLGITVDCPSNVTDNTAVGNPRGNLVLNGTGCNDTNNVAP